MECFTKCIELDSNTIEAYSNLGEVLEIQQRYDLIKL